MCYLIMWQTGTIIKYSIAVLRNCNFATWTAIAPNTLNVLFFFLAKNEDTDISLSWQRRMVVCPLAHNESCSIFISSSMTYFIPGPRPAFLVQGSPVPVRDPGPVLFDLGSGSRAIWINRTWHLSAFPPTRETPLIPSAHRMKFTPWTTQTTRGAKTHILMKKSQIQMCDFYPEGFIQPCNWNFYYKIPSRS